MLCVQLLKNIMRKEMTTSHSPINTTKETRKINDNLNIFRILNFFRLCKHNLLILTGLDYKFHRNPKNILQPILYWTVTVAQVTVLV